MMIDDFDVPGFAVPPYKTDPPLIVDANAALGLTVAVQRFEPVAGRSAQISKLFAASIARSLARARR